MVHVLERAHVLEHPRALATDDQHRHARSLRVGYRCHDVGDARSRSYCGYAGATGGTGPAVGCVTGRLLVAHIDDSYPFVETPVIDSLDVPAAQREQVCHTLLFQCSRNDATAVNGRCTHDLTP